MKRLYGLIAIILVFLGFAFVQEQTSSTGRPSAGKPTVGILQLMSHPALDAIHHGIIKGLADDGFKADRDVKIDFQNAQNDQSNLQTMSNRFVTEGANVAVGIATPSAQALANASSKMPIVLGAVTDPKGAGLVKNNQHPGANITGVSDQAPLAQQLGLIKRLMPHMKTLGIMYTSSDDSAVTQYKEFKALCDREHVALKATQSQTLMTSNKSLNKWFKTWTPFMSQPTTQWPVRCRRWPIMPRPLKYQSSQPLILWLKTVALQHTVLTNTNSGSKREKWSPAS